MNSIIIYFSRDGSTKIIADFLAQRLGSTIVALQGKKNRHGFIRSGFLSSTGKRPPLAGDPWSEMKDKEVVILGAPVWAGNGNPIMNSFLDKADLNQKKVYYFTVQADPKLQSSGKVLQFLKGRIEEKGGIPAGSHAFHGNSPGKSGDSEYLKKQADSWAFSD